MQHALSVAREQGARRLVVQGDPNAHAFYVRHGGQQVGSRPSDSIAGRTLPLFHFQL